MTDSIITGATIKGGDWADAKAREHNHGGPTARLICSSDPCPDCVALAALLRDVYKAGQEREASHADLRIAQAKHYEAQKPDYDTGLEGMKQRITGVSESYEDRRDD